MFVVRFIILCAHSNMEEWLMTAYLEFTLIINHHVQKKKNKKMKNISKNRVVFLVIELL